jgi:hypothetical protein
MPIAPKYIFFILEIVFSMLLFCALKATLTTATPHGLSTGSKRQAYAWTVLFFLLLPLITVINYRYLWKGGDAALYYVYDTSTLFFMILGFNLCMQKRFNLFYPLLVLATLNRETSILLVLLIPLIHPVKTVFKPFLWALGIYVITHALTLYWAMPLGGHLVEWLYRDGIHTHFFTNMYWLFQDNRLFLFFFAMAGFPLLWFTFYDYIPKQFRPLKYLLLAYFLGLLVVGNFMETRIFLEIVALMYMPLTLALSSWLSNEGPIDSGPVTVWSWLDRHAVLLCLALVCIYYTVSK